MLTKIATEVAGNMLSALKESNKKNTDSKILEAFNLLNEAAVLFDSIGSDKCSFLVTKIMTKMASDLYKSKSEIADMLDEERAEWQEDEKSDNHWDKQKNESSDDLEIENLLNDKWEEEYKQSDDYWEERAELSNQMGDPDHLDEVLNQKQNEAASWTKGPASREVAQDTLGLKNYEYDLDMHEPDPDIDYRNLGMTELYDNKPERVEMEIDDLEYDEQFHDDEYFPRKVRK